MGILSKRKNRKFSYQPRYYKGDGNPYEIKHKFNDYRQTVGENPSFKQKVITAFNEFKNSPDKSVNRRIIIIILMFVLVFLILIDFDLTIFLT